MALAAIMVHVDFDDHAEDRIGVAAEIAGRFNSVLIGVAGWALRKNLGAQNSVVDFEPGEEGRRRISAQLDQLGERFRQCAGANPRGVEWRSFANFPSEVIASEARAADLVVMGRDVLPGDVYHTFDPGTVILAAVGPRWYCRVQHVTSGLHVSSSRGKTRGKRAARFATRYRS